MTHNKEHINKAYLSIRSRISRMVSHIVPPKEIEDIVQETYVRVCQTKHVDHIQHPRSFMLKTARNLALDHLKRSETRLAQSMDEALEAEWMEQRARGDDTYDRVVANQEFADFCEAVRLLPQQCRKVFVLKKVYGYSQREIAQQLNISESTVEKHIATGIKRCTQFMTSRDLPAETQQHTSKMRNGVHP